MSARQVPAAHDRGQPVCDELAWCRPADPGDHADFHSGDTVTVGNPRDGGDFWSAWLVRHRDADRTSLVLEGRLAGRHMDVQVPAYDVAVLLAAHRTSPELAEALDALLAQVGTR